MNTLFQKTIIFLFCLVCFFSFCDNGFSYSLFGGGDEVTPYDKFIVTVLTENDVYVNLPVDKYYTAGNKVNFTTKEIDFANSGEYYPNWLEYLGGIGLAGYPRVTKFNVGITQEIYTPKTKSPIPDINDRPYAGYLYLSFGLTNRNSRVEERLWLDTGVVGPMSLAKEVQDFIHINILKHDSVWPGWDYQLGNEFALNLNYQITRKYFIFSDGVLSADALLTLGGALGNIDIHFAADGRFRYGYNLDADFGVPKINMSYSSSTVYSDEFSFYIFFGAGGRLIGHNIFLSGNTYGKGTEIDVIPFVHDFELGLALAINGFRISYIYTFKSGEFKTQDAGTNVGTILLEFAF